MSRLKNLLYWCLVGTCLGTLAAAMAGCAGSTILRAGEARGTQAGAGVVVGWLAWMIHPIGWIGAGLAALGGALGAMFFAPLPTAPGAPAPGVPWFRLAGFAVTVALILSPRLRAWAWSSVLAFVAKVRAK